MLVGALVSSSVFLLVVSHGGVSFFGFEIIVPGILSLFFVIRQVRLMLVRPGPPVRVELMPPYPRRGEIAEVRWRAPAGLDPDWLELVLSEHVVVKDQNGGTKLGRALAVHSICEAEGPRAAEGEARFQVPEPALRHVQDRKWRLTVRSRARGGRETVDSYDIGIIRAPAITGVRSRSS